MILSLILKLKNSQKECCIKLMNSEKGEVYEKN